MLFKYFYRPIEALAYSPLEVNMEIQQHAEGKLKLTPFLVTLFLLSIPLWILGYALDATKIIPVKLPISALQFLCVPVAAIIEVKRQGNSVSALLIRGFDYNRIRSIPWHFAIFILMPVTVYFSYIIMEWNGMQLPTQATPLWNIPIFLLIYGFSGYCEEIGWMSIVTDRLLTRYNIVITGFIVGIIWVTWHLIPFTQTHNSTIWIFWQCVFTIVNRILITKIYILTNRSVFAAIVLHMTYNTAFSMMPYYGSAYNPMYMVLATLITCVGVFIIGGIDTLKKNSDPSSSLTRNRV
ncbi:MAG TPA: CPBP family intramembrane glutamic endopeptidase [Sphingobacteriaceae bacterium]